MGGNTTRLVVLFSVAVVALIRADESLDRIHGRTGSAGTVNRLSAASRVSTLLPTGYWLWIAVLSALRRRGGGPRADLQIIS